MSTDFVHRSNWVMGGRGLHFNRRSVPHPGDIESLLEAA
jgi:hypothetical protein